MTVATSHDNAAKIEPIHVAYFIDQLCEAGGAERMLLNTIRLLPKERFRCSLITFKLDSSAELFRFLPCPHFVYPLRRTYDWNAFRVSSRIREFLKTEKVQIVHTFHETADLWAGLVSKIGHDRILVSSRRDMGILRTLKHHLGYRALNPMVDLVLTVSDEVRRFCIRTDGISPQKVATLYNGLELARVDLQRGAESLRRNLSVDLNAPLIATVGHVRAVKGIDVLVRIATIVVRQYPAAIFVIVGKNSDTEYSKTIRAEIQRLGLSSNILFLGESHEVPSLLHQCNVFLLPSRSEGFSNALIEAMACGLPCVATNVGGNGEAVSDGESGYLFDNEDADGAAGHLIRLLKYPGSARAMGVASRQIVERRFTSGIMIDQLTQHYERLLAVRRN